MSNLCYFAPFFSFFFCFFSLSFLFFSFFFLCFFDPFGGSIDSASLLKRPAQSTSLLIEPMSESAAPIAALDGAAGVADDGAAGAGSVSALHLRRRLGGA